LLKTLFIFIQDTRPEFSWKYCEDYVALNGSFTAVCRQNIFNFTYIITTSTLRCFNVANAVLHVFHLFVLLYSCVRGTPYVIPDVYNLSVCLFARQFNSKSKLRPSNVVQRLIIHNRVLGTVKLKIKKTGSEMSKSLLACSDCISRTTANKF